MPVRRIAATSAALCALATSSVLMTFAAPGSVASDLLNPLGLNPLGEGVAHAADSVAKDTAAEDTANKPTEIMKARRFSLDSRVELTPMVGISVNDRYSEHIYFGLDTLYHLSDTFALELLATYALGSESSLVQDGIRNPPPDANIELDANGRLVDTGGEVADRNLLTWTAVIAAQWEPFYGKLSFFSDLDLHFGVYFVLGGGVTGTDRERLCDGYHERNPPRDNLQGATPAVNPNCGTWNGSSITPAEDAAEVLPLLHFGGGFRFFFTELFSLKFELRNHVVWSTIKVEDVSTAAGGGVQPTFKDTTDVTHYPMMLLGGAFAF